MIGAGAKILGNIEVGKGAKIGAGSVVLQAIPPHTTAAGVPARIVGVRRAIRRRWIWTNTSTAPITALSTATAFEFIYIWYTRIFLASTFKRILRFMYFTVLIRIALKS